MVLSSGAILRMRPLPIRISVDRFREEVAADRLPTPIATVSG
jgi:hypothetical protein